MSGQEGTPNGADRLADDPATVVRNALYAGAAPESAYEALDVLLRALREVWEAADALTDPARVTTGEVSEYIAAVRMTRAVERAGALARLDSGAAEEDA